MHARMIIRLHLGIRDQFTRVGFDPPSQAGRPVVEIQDTANAYGLKWHVAVT